MPVPIPPLASADLPDRKQRLWKLAGPGAMLGGFAMAGYVPMLLYMNLRYLPSSARPKPLNIIMVSLGGITYISFAVYTVWSKLKEIFPTAWWRAGSLGSGAR